MKRIIKKAVALVIAVGMICALSPVALAQGKVTYSADSDRFIFEPGSTYSPTDLFTDYKDLMPGDSVMQNITVRNDESHGVKVRIYVRSLGAHEDSVDFLSKLHLTVAKAEDNEMAYMFDAESDKTDGMTDWVCLGTLYSGGEVDLILKLDVPADLGNEYQNAIGYLDWEFKVDELPIEPGDPQAPETGDNSVFYMYVSLISVAACLAVVIIVCKRRKEAQ